MESIRKYLTSENILVAVVIALMIGMAFGSCGTGLFLEASVHVESSSKPTEPK